MGGEHILLTMLKLLLFFKGNAIVCSPIFLLAQERHEEHSWLLSHSYETVKKACEMMAEQKYSHSENNFLNKRFQYNKFHRAAWSD